MIKHYRLWLVIFLSVLLTACATVSPPSNTENLCTIFHEYPNWHVATVNTQRRWGVPVTVQMAIMNQESSFQSDARPPRQVLLGFIPWSRPTSAYGYCQAINHTWRLYQNATGRYDANRCEFADASDFVGWYGARAKKRAGIHLDDAYGLYLAYHEGITNYMNKTYLRKPWLLRVAKRVQNRAKLYQKQMENCW